MKVQPGLEMVEVMSMEEQIKDLVGMLKESTYPVAVVGPELSAVSGLPNFIQEEDICEIESEYREALVDLFSARFYETRTEQFFRFYRKEIAIDKAPGKACYYLTRLQQAGFLKEIITKDIYALPERAGCTNVVSLNGSIYENYCQKCGKTYTLSQILEQKGVPLCEKCKVKLRPNILLIGEMIDNSRMTKAANAVERADFLLVIGANLNEAQLMNFIRNYQGNRLAIMNRELKLLDFQAESAIEGDIEIILQKLLERLI